MVGINDSEIPNTSQAESIRPCLVDVDNDIDNLEDQIEQIKLSLKKHLKKRDDLRTFASDHRALFTSARRLSPEILLEILYDARKAVHENPKILKYPKPRSTMVGEIRWLRLDDRHFRR